ncbi:hypothetical protein PILCRDRAFT_11424 [Piloderma croceum F 1598]|uniref:Uncharacterized protein n=1 Tax=Piloderma croceum (strain F 1598) TaxID=765440 RepID=A0A0C3F0A0_PILCF|nr:hypothetical protein PILCRDRAFT_11424 [Piloderma croceum F 1598]
MRLSIRRQRLRKERRRQDRGERPSYWKEFCRARRSVPEIVTDAKAYAVTVDSATDAKTIEIGIQADLSTCTTATFADAAVDAAPVPVAKTLYVEVGIQTTSECDEDTVEVGVQAGISEPLMPTYSCSDIGLQTEPSETLEHQLNSNIEVSSATKTVDGEDERGLRGTINYGESCRARADGCEIKEASKDIEEKEMHATYLLGQECASGDEIAAETHGLWTEEAYNRYPQDVRFTLDQAGLPSTELEAPVPEPNAFFLYIQDLMAKVEGLEAENNILRVAMSQPIHCQGCNCAVGKAREAPAGEKVETDPLSCNDAAWRSQDAQQFPLVPANPPTAFIPSETMWQGQSELSTGDQHGDTNMEQMHEIELPPSGNPTRPSFSDLSLSASKHTDSDAQQYILGSGDMSIDAHRNPESLDSGWHDVVQFETGTLPAYPAASPLHTMPDNISSDCSEPFNNVSSTSFAAVAYIAENTFSYTLSGALGPGAMEYKSSTDNMPPIPPLSGAINGSNYPQSEWSPAGIFDSESFWAAARRTWEQCMVNADKAAMMVRFADQTDIQHQYKFFSRSFDWEGAQKIVDRMSIDNPKWVEEFVNALLASAHEDDIPFLEAGPSSRFYHTALNDSTSFGDYDLQSPWSPSARADIDIQAKDLSSTPENSRGASPHRERDHNLPNEDNLAESQKFTVWTEPSWATEPAFSEPFSPTPAGWGDISGESSSSTAAESPRSLSSSSTVSLGDEWLSQDQQDEKLIRSLAAMGPEDDLPSQPQPM